MEENEKIKNEQTAYRQEKNEYKSPFSTRYASKEMQYVFSENFKFTTWHKLWIALAKAEKELGLDISDDQIAEMEKYKDDINYETEAEFERAVRHDVMAHVKAFGVQAKSAEKIIHLGATSCFVADNAEIIIIDSALDLIMQKLVNVMANLKKFALE